MPNASAASVTVGPLADNASYHWQARAKDNVGHTSAWAAFPITLGNPETATDFSVQQPPVQLGFTVEPVSTAVGAAITPAIQVTALGANSQPSTGYTGNVTMTIEANPGGGTLSGTITVAAVAGVATFADLSINRAGTGFTLRATTFLPSLTIVSAPFDITHRKP